MQQTQTGSQDDYGQEAIRPSSRVGSPSEPEMESGDSGSQGSTHKSRFYFPLALKAHEHYLVEVPDPFGNVGLCRNTLHPLPDCQWREGWNQPWCCGGI